MKELAKCPNCGKQNKVTAKFCEGCGTDLTNIAATSTSKESESTSGGPMGWWNKQSTKGKAAVGIAGICCLGLILIVGIGGLLSPDNTNSTPQSSQSNVSSTQTTTSTPTETESQYKSSCKSISFKQLKKDPDKYAGQRVKYTGTIVQIMENYGLTEIRMDVNDNFGDTIYVTYDGTTSAVEDDSITVYGEVYGSYTYESQAGWEITLPRIDAKYINVA